MAAEFACPIGIFLFTDWSDGLTGPWGWERAVSFSSLHLLTRTPACFKLQCCGGKSPGPHRHKHATDWTNDRLPQSIFSSAAWPGVTGRNCHRLLKGWTTMGSLCEDADQFTSSSPGLLMLFVVVFPVRYFNEETEKPQTLLPLNCINFLPQCWRDFVPKL